MANLNVTNNLSDDEVIVVDEEPTAGGGAPDEPNRPLQGQPPNLPYRCSTALCTYSSGRKDDVKRHERNAAKPGGHHKMPKPTTCRHCHKEFTSNLLRHEQQCQDARTGIR